MVLMTAFSPPASIRTTGSTLGSGTHVNTITSNAQYAAWWLESMQYYQSQGALPDAITLQNEPDITSSAYENCWFSPAGYGAALDATRKLFAQQTDAELHDMRFFGPEVCETNDLASYMIEPTSADVEAITHHFYGDLSDATLGKIESDYNWWKWNKYETENSATGFVPAAGEPKYMGLAVDIYKCLAIEEANAYLIWDLAWQIDSVHYTPITYTYEANMLGQYAKFVQPGDWHIYESNSDADVLCTAYKHNLNNGDKERMVMVIVNTAAAAKTVRLDLSAFWASKAAHCLYNVYQTSPTANLVHTTAYSGAAAKKLGNPLVSLPGYSVTTVIQN
jgi:O-glycosyl hydrolase